MTLYSICPRCPECGAALKVRTNRALQDQFLGCSGYPDCKFTAGYEPAEQALAAQIDKLEAQLVLAIHQGPNRHAGRMTREVAAEQLKRLVFECHPDRNPHGVDSGAITQKLLRLRSDLLEAAA